MTEFGSPLSIAMGLAYVYQHISVRGSAIALPLTNGLAGSCQRLIF